MKIILTGGGTAGHIWPIVAISEILLKNKRLDILYVGSFNGPERKIASDYNIPYKRLITGKRRDYTSFSNFIDGIKIVIGLIQAYYLIKIYKPNLIFSKGGYVSFPLVYWAKKLKIPLITHESDIIMGKANAFANSFARKICLGFPLQYYKDIPLDKAIYTGIPVRKEFFAGMPIERDKPTLLITGGSQGSQKINEVMSEILLELLKKYEVYHLCGENNITNLDNKISNDNYHLMAFTNDMAKLMRNADLIISRAGATTLAEISALGKPSILIPLPSAHADHQSVNAKIYADNNAAVTLKEKSLTSSSLLSIINQLMEDKNMLKIIGNHARQFARPDSASEIVDIIFGELNK